MTQTISILLYIVNNYDIKMLSSIYVKKYKEKHSPIPSQQPQRKSLMSTYDIIPDTRCNFAPLIDPML